MKKVIAIASIVAFALTSTAVFAGDITVTNNNGAAVVNGVSSSANTGSNFAGGADGGNGGDAGDIDGGKVKNSNTGNGGAGGDAGAGSGGTVMTGDADSEAGVLNVVNSNATSVEDDCGCRGKRNRGNDITVTNNNRAFVANGVGSDANSGQNAAGGADGGDGGNGGDIDAGSNKVKKSNTGNGGAGGEAGEGGWVDSGKASSKSGIVNVVNTNLTRVRR